MSKKNTDSANRWRSKTIAFRVTPEENEQIDRLVQIYGISKQDYLTSNMLKSTINVTGSIQAFKGMRTQIDLLMEELQQASPTDEQLQLIKEILSFYHDCC